MKQDNREMKRRRGAVLAFVLVCLFVVAAVGMALLRVTVDEHRQETRRQHQAQALWLAESAVQRAAAQLTAAPDYQGETWQIDAEDLGDRWPAVAVIRVQKVEADESARQVSVEARYPEDEQHRIVQRRQVIIRVPKTGESP
jgi:Tfp pilus assembly protein PilX